MTHPDPQPPAERLAALLVRLTQLVAEMSGGDRLSYFVIGLISIRLIDIRQCFRRVAARVAAGTYFPRTRTAIRKESVAPEKTPAEPEQKPAAPAISPAQKLPRHKGWLLKMVPNAVWSRGFIEKLFNDPEMLALMAAAPKTLGRPVRSLCRALALPVPAPVALPKKPREPRPRWKWVKVPYERPPSPPDLPEWIRTMPQSAKWPGGRIRVLVHPPPKKP